MNMDMCKQLFNLSPAHGRLFMLFCRHKSKSFTLKQLSRLTHLDRTTLQKQTNFLVRKNLLDYEQVNLDGGGYYYTYRVANAESIGLIAQDNLTKAMIQLDKVLLR